MHINLERRVFIIELFLNKQPIHLIQKKLKSKYGITVSRTAIYKLINKFKKNDRLTNMPKTGRLPILNKHELNFLCDLIKHNREITPKTLKKDILLKYNKICYESTIRNSAKKMLWTKKFK